VGGELPAAARKSDAAAVKAVEDAITREAAKRQHAGELRRTPVAKRSVCKPLHDGTQLVKPKPDEVLLDCTAVIAGTPPGAKPAVISGFSFRGRANLRTGVYAVCYFETPPAEGGSDITRSVALSRRCTG
jgi:hypothetical protein